MIALLGGVVVFKVLERPPAQFKPPPPPPKTTKIEPRKLQHKIKIREQQQNSGRPRVSPRLTANRVSGISLPEIEVDPMAEPVKTNIQKNIGKNFSANGLGTGFGTGTGTPDSAWERRPSPFLVSRALASASPSWSIFRAAWSRTRRAA